MKLFGKKKEPEQYDSCDAQQRNAEDVPCNIDHILKVLKGRIGLYQYKLQMNTGDHITSEKAIELFNADAGVGTKHIGEVLRQKEPPNDQLLGVLGYERWRPPQELYIRKKVD